MSRLAEWFWGEAFVLSGKRSIRQMRGSTRLTVFLYSRYLAARKKAHAR